jgi:rhodanese-related sulfurtransferase
MTAAQGFQTGSPSYAGDVSARDAWEGLTGDRGAQLVDCRTEAEWTFVGIPDLTQLSRQPLLCEWQRYPGGTANKNFTAEIAAALEAAGYVKGAPLYFLCRSGARSRAAAIAMTAAGYGPCFNIREGFEGGLDDERRRGRSAGWKVAGLPWVQS